MRLWHIDLLHYLPKSQLRSQWCELNSVFKNQNRHILINYVYEYPKEYLLSYAKAVIDEFERRGYRYNTYTYNTYFKGNVSSADSGGLRFKEHNDEYLTICYWNLREKYLRKQNDFTLEVWEKLDRFYKEKLNER